MNNLPDLPEPDFGYIKTSHSNQPAFSAPTAEQGEPVYWEWRHLSTHPNTADFGKWSEWARVEPRYAMRTVEDTLTEFRSYISGGHKYELRALYTRPQPSHLPDAGKVSQPAREPMTRQQVKAMMRENGYEGASASTRADFINGLRHGERFHGITAKEGGQ